MYSENRNNNNYLIYFKYNLTYICILILYVNLVSAQDIDPREPSKDVFCSQALNCSSCISRPQCAWCSSTDKKSSSQIRCDYPDNLLTNGCPDENIVNPASSVESDSDSVQRSPTDDPVQLYPRKFHLHIRQNDLQRFRLKYEQPLEYPIDLYYLMDLTISMKDHKEKLHELAQTISENMNKISKSFRLGFGSFIDKVVMPYANMVERKLANPCTDGIDCVPAYGFKNHLPLNTNISQFAEEVRSANLSGNLDDAEGGFDAIIQVIACREQIKWNQLSRKIILFATDSMFHYAGDGKLGGIIKPNDGKCHLDSDGYYSETLDQDYPSLSQIHRSVFESKINIIFAVPEHKLNVYQQLSQHIPGSTTALLKNDSSNIVEIIRDNFKKIAEKVQLNDTAPEYVQIRYMSSCLGGSIRETSVCENVGVGQTVEFEVEIKVTECPPNGTLYFNITPVGINQYTVVELHVMCQCECESETVAKQNSTECSEAGTYACGVCECDENRFGKRCECGGDDAIRDDLINQCKRNLNGTVLCSGRGNCYCGECQCHTRTDPTEIISGRFCECDSFSCARDINGHICGGHQRGTCCNGECHCMTGWTGPVCDCSVSNITCIYNELSKNVCSGRGECRCGSCRCDEGYYGQFCEDCASCDGRCNELQQCVECKVFNSGTLSPVECEDHCQFTFETIDLLDEQQNVRRCYYQDSEDCTISFDYQYNYDNQLLIRVKEQPECPQDVNTALVVGSVALLTLLIGALILLLFRLIIWYKDKKEYEKWSHEAKLSRETMLKDKTETNKNPLFKPAETTHMNPMYGKAKY